MSFKPNPLYYTDAYKVGHQKMLAKGTTRLYGTWIPRSIKHAPEGITKIVSFGQQLVVQWLHDMFEENFFDIRKNEAIFFVKDMASMLGQEYDGKHFEELWELGYLPIKIKSLPEGIETNPNIPHMTFVNTADGFGWLTLFLETIISSLAWKPSTSATIALHYRRQCAKWVMQTDPDSAWLIDYLCHDFSARGLDPHSMLASGLGHATAFRGSDSLITIPGARYYYDEPEDEVIINSVNASEHSVSTTKIFTVGEQQMLSDWLKDFPNGILSVVSDTFNLWKLITKYLPNIKEQILNRYGKLVIRPDSGDPVDIICGNLFNQVRDDTSYEDVLLYATKNGLTPANKGVIELLWDIFGGTVNEQGYKVLDSHIGAIYGDSITPERQVEIYKRLAAKGFASTNIVLGIGSYTYQYNTRDTFGFAAKGSWFEVVESSDNDTCPDGENCTKIGRCQNECCGTKTSYNIYKDPTTDDGTKKSLKGLQAVFKDEGTGEYEVYSEVDWETEEKGALQTIYEDGEFFNTTTFKQVREKINKL